MLSLCALVLIRMDRLRRCELAVAPRKQSVWIPMRNLQARRRALRGRYRARSALRASSSPPGRIDGDEKGAIDESGRLAASDVRARTREPGRLLRVYLRLRKHLKGLLMTFVTIAVAAFVIVYLFTALVRPEWF
jgi:hypothetical protein